MQPITFTCRATLPQSAAEIRAGIADLARWSDFEGFGPLPGIAEARWERRTEAMVGSRIAVSNSDGSRHVEEIQVWQPAQVVMVLKEFTPPLSKIAAHFREEWRFEEAEGKTRVERRFELHPHGAGGRVALWGISWLFRQAIAKQLRDMAREGEGEWG